MFYEGLAINYFSKTLHSPCWLFYGKQSDTLLQAFFIGNAFFQLSLSVA